MRSWNLNTKKIVNLLAHDGITSCYSGVGTIARSYIKVLTELSSEYSFTLNLFSPAYNTDAFGYNARVRDENNKLVKRSGGKIYYLNNGSSGSLNYGYVNNWKLLCQSAQEIITKLSVDKPIYNIAFDTPFAGLSPFINQAMSNSNFKTLWLPHSTVKIHKIDSAITQPKEYERIRRQWEMEAIKIANRNKQFFIGLIGNYMANHLVHDYGLNPKKGIAFTNGVLIGNKQTKPNPSILEKIGLNSSDKFILSFGRAEYYKNFDFTIRLGGLLIQDGYKAVLIASPYSPLDPILEHYRGLIKRHNKQCILLDDSPFELSHILMCLPQCRAIIVPSTAEPFGLIPEEARLLNNPKLLTVVSNVGGLTEQINDGYDGIYININNLEESYQKILAYLKNEAMVKMLAMNGFCTLNKNYDLRKNIKKGLLELINA